MPSKADEFKAHVEKRLRRGGDLATLATVLRKLQVVAADEHSSAQDLAAVIREDPVLTSKMLKIANSATMAVEHKISNVDEAVVILGYSRLKAVTSGVLAMDILCTKGQCRNLDRVGLWKHSLGTAAASAHLQTRYVKERPATDLFTAGLLCNVGRVILDQWFGEECVQIHAVAEQRKCTLLDAEREVLGVTHAEVGFWAAEAWHFEEAMAHVIRHHHGPALNRASDVVNLAYVLTQARRVGSPGEPRMANLVPGVLSRLEIDDLALDGILRQLTGVYRSMDPIFTNMAQA